MHKIIALAEKHPVITGLAVFGIGLIVLWLLGFFSSSSSGGDTGTGASSYFAAQAAQAQISGQVQIAQIAANAATAQTQTAAHSAENIQQTWANAQVQETSSAESEKLFAALAPIISNAQKSQTMWGLNLGPAFGSIGGSNSTFPTFNPNTLSGMGLTPAAIDTLLGLPAGSFSPSVA